MGTSVRANDSTAKETINTIYLGISITIARGRSKAVNYQGL